MLKNLLQRFIKNKIDDCSEEYFYILRIVYMNLNSDERYLSNNIKHNLNNFNIADREQLKKKIEISKRILSKIEIKNNTKKLNYIPNLKSVQIKNFRSFGHFDSKDKGVKFEFDKNKNILFAPNGGGKSSFCEALEYKLTGEIKEAKRRNIGIGSYVKYKESFIPNIKVEFFKEDYELSLEDKSLLKYTFIEKNRLNEFALLGSKDTGTNERDILAILLDLEEFDSFISKFVQAKSLALDSLKSNTLKTKNSELVENMNKIKDDREKSIIKIKELNQQKKLINVRKELIKSKKEKKEYSDKILKVKSKKINYHTKDDLGKLFEKCSKQIKEYNKVIDELLEKKDKQNYRKLYDSIIDLKNDIEEKGCCPVCDTSFDNVKINPISKASVEIKKLSEIVDLETQKEKYEQEIQKTFDELKEVELMIKNNLAEHIELKEENIKFITESKKDNSKDILKEKFEAYTSGNLENYFKIVNEINKEVSKVSLTVEKYKLKIEELEVKENELKKILQEFKSIAQLVGKYSEDVKNIKNEIEQVSELFKNEQLKNDFIDNVFLAYEQFRKNIDEFKLKLEQERLENIENDTLSFYNQINKHDDESEYLNNINFEKGDKKYCINIEINDEEKDAFNYLSEGHLRSLGLSIMLALIKKLKIPFIVFDDVVNAIDTEHRANIIDMFYNDKFLKDKQL
ncbi:MAG: hypothetical protein WA916_01765, partial [Arcobacter sp.]|uniref:hypothetical protein n=1 Tax=Arcobacter sp. TaxID=1872629 RepID=UPI003C766AB0